MCEGYCDELYMRYLKFLFGGSVEGRDDVIALLANVAAFVSDNRQMNNNSVHKFFGRNEITHDMTYFCHGGLFLFFFTEMAFVVQNNHVH